MKAEKMTYTERVKTLRRALAFFMEGDSIVELRVPKSDDGPRAGLFDDLDEIAEAAADISGKAPGVYVTLNPVKQPSTGRVKNALAKTSSAVRDTDIDRRRLLLLDFDPVRPSDSPSTDEEHEAAIATARSCQDFLANMGWPQAVMADSGNGAHDLYRINLPNDRESYTLIRRCLLAVSLWFSTTKVKLDTGNGNASRLTRLYGTMNRKGDQTDDRPYRRSRLLEVPEKIQIVTAERLSQVAGALPVPPAERSRQQIGVDAWLKEYELPVAFDAPWNAADHKWILRECPWNESHKKSAFIVQFADGGVDAGCLHKSCAGKGWPQLREKFEGQPDAAEPESSPSLPIRSQKQSAQSDRIIQLATPELELFRTPQGEPHTTIRFETHNEHHGVGSTAFREYLSRKYFQATKTALQPTAVSQAVSQFSAVARFGETIEPVFVRVGKAAGRNYLDLADSRWAAIEFTIDGWRVVEKPPIRFRRPKGMLALPRPVRSGAINDLREFLNLRTDEDWVLFVTNLVNALFPAGPYTILGLHGEQGSGKTTAARIHRKMFDPNFSPARGMPKDERDLMVMAVNNWGLVFDNLSFLPIWFSDSLCRLSTGGGISRRSLYTDADEFIFDGQRPVVLNGIEELVSRTDLLARSVLLELPVIRKYKAEQEFWTKFDAAHPQLLGAMLDVAVGALQRLPKVKLADQPRMADFALLGIAVESVLRLPQGTFTKAYNRNRQDATAVALEASPIATPILELGKQRWEGSATELLGRLSNMVDVETRSRRSWPKNPKVLSGMVRRLAPALRTAGVETDVDIRDNTRSRNKTIRIRPREPKKNAEE
jgi:hypothetical protein